MFDFQVAQNVQLAKTVLGETQHREREWMA
jgi:hypothetical protein